MVRTPVTRQCSEPGCTNPAKTRGMCNKHYLRWWSSTPKEERPPADPAEAARYIPYGDYLMSLVEIQPNGCWRYLGHVSKLGYGQIKRAQRTQPAHRVFYETFVGPIPQRRPLDHLCHNADPDCRAGKGCPHRRCCNPDHLEPVLTAENNRRARKRKTHCKRGHPLTGDNLFIDGQGARQCRQCALLRDEASRRRRGVAERVTPTHCPQGHPYDDENTAWGVRGDRRCRACQREASAKYRAKTPRKRWPEPTRSRPERCGHGHPMDEANAYWNTSGWWACRTCVREAQRRRAAKKKTI